MRRIVLLLAALASLAAPAAVLAAKDAPGDGTLVVRNGEAPAGTPVVQLTITGSVIGQVTNQGRIIIDAGPDGSPVEVTGAGNPHDVSPKDTAQSWSSPDGFKFRAIGGTFTILIYGSGVNLFAVGSGTVQLAGMPGVAIGDGKYSINGKDFRSLPNVPTKPLSIGING